MAFSFENICQVLGLNTAGGSESNCSAIKGGYLYALKAAPKDQLAASLVRLARKLPGGRSGYVKGHRTYAEGPPGPTRLLVSGEFKGKVRSAEITCDNGAFIRRLYQKIKPLRGRPIKEIGDLEIEG